MRKKTIFLTLILISISFFGFTSAEKTQFDSDGTCCSKDGAGNEVYGSWTATTINRFGGNRKVQLCTFDKPFKDKDGKTILKVAINIGVRSFGVINGGSNSNLRTSTDTDITHSVGSDMSGIKGSTSSPSYIKNYDLWDFTINGIVQENCIVSAIFTGFNGKYNPSNYNALQLTKVPSIKMEDQGFCRIDSKTKERICTETKYFCSLSGAFPIYQNSLNLNNRSISQNSNLDSLLINRIDPNLISIDSLGIAKNKLTNDYLTKVKYGTETIYIPAVSLSDFSNLSTSTRLTSTASEISNTSNLSTTKLNKQILDLQKKVSYLQSVIDNIASELNNSKNGSITKAGLQNALTNASQQQSTLQLFK